MLAWTGKPPNISRDGSQSRTANTDNNNHPFFRPLLQEINLALDLLSQQTSQQTVKKDENNSVLTETKNLVQYLLEIKQIAKNAYSYQRKSSFNFEKLVSMVRTTRLNSAYYSEEIIRCIINIYTMIEQDIKMPAEQQGGNFFYTEISEDSASNLIKDLINTDEKTPAGAMLWQICLGSNPDQAAKLNKNHADLLLKMRQLSSFERYDPFSKNNLGILMIVKENPVFYGFFTAKQLISFICTLAELDSAILNTRGHVRSTTQPKNIIEEQHNKYKFILTSIILKPENILYLKRLINEAAVDKDFIFAIGIHAVMLPFLDSHVAINCFQAVDQWFYLRASALDILKDNEVHYELNLLFARIIEDISKGDVRCLRELQQRPYLLYEFISRNLLGCPEALNVNLPQLISLFRAFGHEIILLTLQLVDPLDKEHQTFCMNSVDYPIDKSTDNLREQRSIKLPFKRLTNLLLIDELADIRKEWVQNAKANKLLLEYPFLFCGCNYFEVKKFVLDNRNYRFKTIQCINNDVNPYVYCPFLLAFLPAEEIITLNNNNPKISWIFDSKQQLPADVVIHYIITGSFAKIAGSIISLEEYLNEQIVELFQEADQRLLTEKLLLKMLQDAKMQQLLKDNPSVLSFFDLKIVQNLNREYPFLLELLGQQTSETAEQLQNDQLPVSVSTSANKLSIVPVDVQLPVAQQQQFVDEQRRIKELLDREQKEEEQRRIASVRKQQEDEQARQKELEKQAREESEQRIIKELQERAQKEEEQRRIESKRKQREIEQARQKELQEQAQKESEQRRIKELQDREQLAEEQRRIEREHKQQEIEQARQKELQEQVQKESEQRRIKELQDREQLAEEQRRIDSERKQQEIEQARQKELQEQLQKEKESEQRRNEELCESEQSEDDQRRADELQKQLLESRELMKKIADEQKQREEEEKRNLQRDMKEYLARQKKKDEKSNNKLVQELELKKKRAEEERLKKIEREKRAQEERKKQFEEEQEKMAKALALKQVPAAPKQSVSVDRRRNEAIEVERKKQEEEEKKKLDEEARKRQEDERKRNEIAKAAQERLAEERRQAALLDEALRNKSRGEGKNDDPVDTLSKQAKNKFKAHEEQRLKQEAEKFDRIQRRTEEKERQKKLQEEASKQSTGDNQQQVNGDSHVADAVSDLQGVGEKLATKGVFSSASPPASSSSTTRDDTNSSIAATGISFVNTSNSM